MAAESKADHKERIHREAMAEFDAIQKARAPERAMCMEDRRFYAVPGAQWEGALGEQFANKAQPEFNKVHLAVIRIFNEYRNNRITVDFTPKDGAKESDLADTCDGLYRADERDSGAQEAYDNAFEEGVGGGFGAWRLRARYEDDEDDEDTRQRVCIEPIFDADQCVFFNLDAKRQDKADATRCFVLTGMTPEAFEEEYGHPASTWDKKALGIAYDWCLPDLVYVAEYYRVEEKTELVRIFRGLDGQEMPIPAHEFEEDEQKEEDLKATGFQEVRQKKVKRKRVRKYILSGIRCERDEGYIVGDCIPIVPFYGKRWFVDGLERCMGHVRLAKDAQRLFNTMMAWLTDMAARFDIEKPIMTPEQIGRHAQMWADDNIERNPYLLAEMLKDLDGNPIPGSQAPVAYTKAPQIPPAMAALMQVCGVSLDDLLGNQQAGEQIQPNISGKAVELIQNRLDMQVFIYMSNFAKAMKRSGEIWLSMARELLVEDERQMKMVAEDGSTDTVTIRRPVIGKDGEMSLENDLSAAKFDVWSDVGPSSTSRRASTVRALTGMASITTDEQDRSILTAAALMNIEGQGLKGINGHFRRKLVRLGVEEPTEQERAEMAQEQQQQQPDPQAAYLLASAKAAEASAIEREAGAGLKRAQTIETLQGIGNPGASPA